MENTVSEWLVYIVITSHTVLTLCEKKHTHGEHSATTWKTLVPECLADIVISSYTVFFLDYYGKNTHMENTVRKSPLKHLNL
jgi:hypothetical protein